MRTSTSPRSALMILDPTHTELLRELDRTFSGWAMFEGAGELNPPPIYEIADLEKFDVYENFPQLSFVASGIDIGRPHVGPVDGTFPTDQLLPAELGLPMATCYGAYLFYENAELDQDVTVTLVNRCFRNEDSYEGLRRLASFTMREIVAIGSFGHTQDLLARYSDRIATFADQIGLHLTRQAASDPFFQQDGGRALIQKLQPVKHEFLAGDLAISSVNTHRNFFGERCAIRLAAGEYAFTSCVAFGLERWVSALVEAHGGEPAAALTAVRNVTRRAG